ncbi:MAG: phenylalanine--tRNA ligase subunit beta [Candidatus Margulisiibacteriota bacterium]
MKVLFSWLNEFVSIPVSPQELADVLSLSGLEVESVTPFGQQLKGIVTGRIDKIEKHPDADRLHITTIFDGTTNHQIVTGATNIVEGAIVPVSLPGAVLANGMEIKPAKLRGVPSFGMLCSESELGVADQASGIWLLPADTPLGVDFVKEALLQDTLLDIAILPNKGDCQSVVGLAREIAALLQLPLCKPNPQPLVSQALQAPSVRVDGGSPLYSLRTLTLDPSAKTPLQMQRRLQLMGIRPISLAVDITNYVLLECGQPLHVFDADKLQGDLVCRPAQAGETLITLDDESQKLLPSDIVIADATGPVALAGVMGGKHSGVTEATTTLVLEAAYFDPGKVRKTASRLGLRSESSARFEKGVDVGGVAWASDRAAGLLQTLASATVGPRTEFKDEGHPIFQPKWIPFNPGQINGLLGTEFSQQEMQNALQRLGFEEKDQAVLVPSWRQFDIQEWPCLAEEVARILGYDRIPTVVPTVSTPAAALPEVVVQAQVWRHYLTAQGFHEAITFSMVSPDDVAAVGRTPDVVMTNPLTPAQSVLRPHILASLMPVMAAQLLRQVTTLKLFEIGPVFELKGQEVVQTQKVAVAATGPWFEPVYFGPDKAANATDFFALKALIESRLGSTVTYKQDQHPAFHPGRTASIWKGDRCLGIMGELHPDYCAGYGVSEPIVYAEFELALFEPKSTVSGPSKFPSSRRDLAMMMPKTLAFGDLVSVIESHRPALLASYHLFDHYESDQLGTDQKSLALAFIYQDTEKTVSDEAVNQAHGGLVEALLSACPVSIR